MVRSYLALPLAGGAPDQEIRHYKEKHIFFPQSVGFFLFCFFFGVWAALALQVSPVWSECVSFNMLPDCSGNEKKFEEAILGAE